ncbi:hypothetical protein D3C86_2002640 [compost metagenome]
MVPFGSDASFSFRASQQNKLMPSGLPINSPAIMPIGSIDVRPLRVTPCSDTPALAKANSGKIINATHGCSTCSSVLAGELPSCSFSGTKKPIMTPASVA